MESKSRIIIIGAGIVGCGLADQLTRLGCSNVTVLDQGPLFATGGSTSHAPGGVFQTNFNQTMTNFAQYTVQRYRELDLDGLPCFLPVGSIEIATTSARWTDLKRKHGVATSWGTSSQLLTPAECGAKLPELNTSLILGGLFVPTDGIAKPVHAAEAMARAAMARGAIFHGHQEVSDVEVLDGRVRAVITPNGRFPADIVVSCAGIWGPKVGRLAGVSVPLVPMQHQYVISTPVAELSKETDEVTRPLLRHQDEDMYFRQHHNRYGAGYYGHRPLPVSADDLSPYDTSSVMPSIWPFTPEDFAPAWEETIRLLPALANTEIVEAINGIFSFTTDGFPLLGESPEVRGFWLAEAVWITHAAGVARAMAEWMVTGVPSIDLRFCDIKRFESYAVSPSYVMQRSLQGYIEVYDIKHPLEPLEEPRPIRVSPFYPRQQTLGGYFLEAAGWERPQWYSANSSEVADRSIPDREPWAARYWSPIVGAEHQVTRERVAIYDMNSLKKVEVTGPGALALLQRLTTSNLDRPVGSVVYTLMLDEQGGVKSDITVARLAEHRFQLGCNGPRDVDWLQRHAPPDGSAQVRDMSGGICCVGVWGPRARDLVQQLTDEDFSEDGLRYFRAKEAYLREVQVTAMQLSYVGELGWEIYTSADNGLRLWDLLWEAGRPLGVIAAGRGAFDSLRMEKGYRFWGKDMWSEHDPYEAGVGFAVSPKKHDFVGHQALLQRQAAGPRRRLVTATLNDPEQVVMGNEPVYADSRAVGFVTSAAYGYTIGRGLVYAWVPVEYARPGTPLEVEYFRERLAATVTDDTLFDPGMTRLRASARVAVG